MTAPDGYLDVLDPRFPIRLSMPESLFWDMVALRPDRPCADGQAWRARTQAARHEERYVTPAPEPEAGPMLLAAPLPEQAHEDAVVEFTLTDGDRFRPEDTLIVGDLPYRPESPRVMEREMQAAERRHVWHRLRRAMGHRRAA